MADIVLEAKLVGDIAGTFNVPSYQRGYRWGEEEVTRLLSDIHDIFDEESQTAGNYCLQPIVVRRSGDQFVYLQERGDAEPQEITEFRRSVCGRALAVRSAKAN